MTTDSVFQLCSLVAMPGWLALIFVGRIKYVASVVCKFVIPGLLAAFYLGIVVTHWAGHQGGFASVQDVQKLFGDPCLLVAGWIHYLAFDLFLGAWQVRDAQYSNVPHWWTIPCLILTFLFGPLGFCCTCCLKVCVPGRRPEEFLRNVLVGEEGMCRSTGRVGG
ncbi:MAG: ABA4-like family protein [Bryobacteraceae bacterium]